jgi:hypothetical protein
MPSPCTSSSPTAVVVRARAEQRHDLFTAVLLDEAHGGIPGLKVPATISAQQWQRRRGAWTSGTRFHEQT